MKRVITKGTNPEPKSNLNNVFNVDAEVKDIADRTRNVSDNILGGLGAGVDPKVKIKSKPYTMTFLRIAGILLLCIIVSVLLNTAMVWILLIVILLIAMIYLGKLLNDIPEED